MNKNTKDFESFLNGPRNAAANAYVAGNPALVTELSSTNDPATFFGPGGGVLSGADKVIRTNERGAKNFGSGGKSEFKVIQLFADNELAFWTGIQSAKVQVPGRPKKITMKLRVTEVFRYESDAWKLVHRHADMHAKAEKQKR